MGAIVGTLGAIPCCIICPNPYKNVNQGNAGLVTKFGKFYQAVDPGLVKVNPLSERLIQVDVKIQIAGKLCPLPPRLPRPISLTPQSLTTPHHRGSASRPA